MTFALVVVLMAFNDNINVSQEKQKACEQKVAELTSLLQKREEPEPEPVIGEPMSPEDRAEYKRLVPRLTRAFLASKDISIADKVELYFKDVTDEKLERLVKSISKDIMFYFAYTTYTYNGKDLQDLLDKRRAKAQEEYEMISTRNCFSNPKNEMCNPQIPARRAKAQEEYEMIPAHNDSEPEDVTLCYFEQHTEFVYDGMTGEKMDHLVATLGTDTFYNGHSKTSYSKRDLEKILKAIRSSYICGKKDKQEEIPLDEFLASECKDLSFKARASH